MIGWRDCLHLPLFWWSCFRTPAQYSQWNSPWHKHLSAGWRISVQVLGLHDDVLTVTWSARLWALVSSSAVHLLGLFFLRFRMMEDTFISGVDVLRFGTCRQTQLETKQPVWDKWYWPYHCRMCMKTRMWGVWEPEESDRCFPHGSSPELSRSADWLTAWLC